MISKLPRLLRSGLATPMLNLLRGKTVVERVSVLDGRVIKNIITDHGGRFVGRHLVMDAADPMAFQFRMGAGNIGSVNRYHPATIEPTPINSTTPPSIGLAAVIDATAKTLRLVQAGDTALVDIYGIPVRPWPFQQGNSASPNFSGAVGFATTTPVSNQYGVWDVLRSGYIIVPINGAPGKGDAVNVWVAASLGVHTQGGFEASSTGGSTIAITGNDKTTFQGAPDAFGAGEIAFNI
jgi:hypothetical protein